MKTKDVECEILLLAAACLRGTAERSEIKRVVTLALKNNCAHILQREFASITKTLVSLPVK